MDPEFIILRIIHITAGAFWVGSAVFFTFIVEPSLRALGPAVQRPVMAALAPVMMRFMFTSAILTILAGTFMVLRMRWGHFDSFLSSGWGWAILVGAVVSIGALSTGAMTGITAAGMQRLGQSFEGRPPTPEEAGRIQQLSARLLVLGKTTAVLVIIAVGAMASARFLD